MHSISNCANDWAYAESVRSRGRLTTCKVGLGVLIDVVTRDMECSPILLSRNPQPNEPTA